MRYIIHKRFKDDAMCGKVNIPALSVCEEKDNTIYFNDKPICFASSENAHQYFARNDDKQGVERGKLTQTIQHKLSKRDGEYQNRWDKIWEDKVCQKYKLKEYDDFWLWNHEFFNAEIDDLQYIAKLINAER